MSAYNFNNPNCDPIELDRRIRELQTSKGGSSNGGGSGTPSSNIGSSNLVYGYGSSLQNWTDVDFKTVFANFPKNSMGVVDGNFMFSFDAAIGWIVSGVNGYFRILFSMMGIATEENIRKQWEDHPYEVPATSNFNFDRDGFQGIFDTVSMIYWGDVTADFSNEPIKIASSYSGSRGGYTRYNLDIYGEPFDYSSLIPPGGSIPDVILTAYTTHYLKEKRYPWSPDWGFGDSQNNRYSGKPFYINPNLYLTQPRSGYNFSIETNNDGYDGEDWSTFYNDTSLPPQKQINYHWGFQKNNYIPKSSEEYKFPQPVEYSLGDVTHGGCGPSFRVDGGSPFPDAIASKIPDSWNSR